MTEGNCDGETDEKDIVESVRISIGKCYKAFSVCLGWAFVVSYKRREKGR